ncbi:MAG: DUF1963 domain-containing protein [Pyrinomonadaceae bacterium]
MRYFVPKLVEAEELNSQNRFREKFGGSPFGLPTEKHPLCGQCGKPMSLLVQLIHDEERLDLGRTGRVLFIFQCSNQRLLSCCAVWEYDSGANSCFIVESGELTSRFEKLPEGRILTEKEFWVAGWETRDDGLSEPEASVFFDEEKYYASDEELEEIMESLENITKLGSVPTWVQYMEIPEGDWRFVGQLDDSTGFNFGDAGIGYIFVENVGDTSRPPKGKFFWQCG